MPKRVIDGEALWTSSKVRRLPIECRYHYANWLPLASANGGFEVDLDSIRSKVYAASLDPETESIDVYYTLREFVVAGLVSVWKEDSKVWGYFVGIEKAGRLPGMAHLKRCSDLPPALPLAKISISDSLSVLKTLESSTWNVVPMVPQTVSDNQ